MTGRPLAAGTAGARFHSPVRVPSKGWVPPAAPAKCLKTGGGSRRCSRTQEMESKVARARLSRRYKPDNIRLWHRVNAGVGLFSDIYENRNFQCEWHRQPPTGAAG